MLIKGAAAGLFELTPPRVRVEVRAGDKPISAPVSASYGFQEATGDVQLRLLTDDPQKLEDNTVTVMIAGEATQKIVDCSSIGRWHRNSICTFRHRRRHLDLSEETHMPGLDQKAAAVFAGKVVRKDLVRKVKVGANVPVFVLEYLLGKYCATDDPVAIEAGLRVVNTTLADNFVRPDEANKAQSMVHETRASTPSSTRSRSATCPRTTSIGPSW